MNKMQTWGYVTHVNVECIYTNGRVRSGGMTCSSTPNTATPVSTPGSNHSLILLLLTHWLEELEPNRVESSRRDGRERFSLCLQCSCQ